MSSGRQERANWRLSDGPGGAAKIARVEQMERELICPITQELPVGSFVIYFFT